MKEPEQFAQGVEGYPHLPPGDCERVSGYGVMGLPFRSGHVLGLRRWTASSVGERFTSIWHRDPDGRWTFYESVRCDIACTRYFGADVQRVRVGQIGLEWERPSRLHVFTVEDRAVDWTIDMGSTLMTRTMSVIGSALPLAAWRSPKMLDAMGYMAGRVLGLGSIRLRGKTSNGQDFDANPLKIWYVTASEAVIEGQHLGSIGPLREQAHMADFYFPQRGVFAIGRVFITPPRTEPASASAGALAR